MISVSALAATPAAAQTETDAIGEADVHQPSFVSVLSAVTQADGAGTESPSGFAARNESPRDEERPGSTAEAPDGDRAEEQAPATGEADTTQSALISTPPDPAIVCLTFVRMKPFASDSARIESWDSGFADAGAESTSSPPAPGRDAPVTDAAHTVSTELPAPKSSGPDEASIPNGDNGKTGPANQNTQHAARPMEGQADPSEGLETPETSSQTSVPDAVATDADGTSPTPSPIVSAHARRQAAQTPSPQPALPSRTVPPPDHAPVFSAGADRPAPEATRGDRAPSPTPATGVSAAPVPPANVQSAEPASAREPNGKPAAAPTRHAQTVPDLVASTHSGNGIAAPQTWHSHAAQAPASPDALRELAVQRVERFVARFEEHLLASLRGNDGSLTIRFEPPEIGELTLTCQVEGSDLNLNLGSNNPDVQTQLRQHENSLRQIVNDNGYQLAAFSVRGQSGDAGRRRAGERGGTDSERQALGPRRRRRAETEKAETVETNHRAAWNPGVPGGIWIVA
jgi:flagellar hook-length control protein FliK